MASTPTPPARAEDLIEAADGARTRALDEVSSLVRHEVANIAHIARAALESCTRGDIVTGHRRLLGVTARCDDLLKGVSSYCEGAADPAACSVAEVGHVVRSVLARRPGRVGIAIAPEVESLSIRLPCSGFALVLLEIAASLETVTGGRVTLTLGARTDDRVFIHVVTDPTVEPPSWRLAWARAALEPHGAELREVAPGSYTLDLPDAT